MARTPAQPRAWQRMLSGRRLDLLDPSPLDIEIEDIAHGLARVARWNGQTHGAHSFSVAQHSLLVEAIASHLHPDWSDGWRLMALLHDAPEYVIGDMISPFKLVMGDAYKDVENRLLGAIHLRFGLPPQTPAPLKKKTKEADTIAAFFEATRLAGFAREEALVYFGRPKALPAEVLAWLDPLDTEAAQALFLARFAALSGIAPPAGPIASAGPG
ncbi:YfbR-like 5'-deoxynucleotidase [Bosea sp. (in: a-proteobacteria)]|uniref:YfbR-like 5'-deoxynucleotidase n=1 Tax=Bosea sp. (in: a-proteobacteria) TaxID=1871050 RepID=UPI003B3AEF8C